MKPKIQSADAFTAKAVAAFELMEASLNGARQSQLHQLRKQALASFRELGYPTTKHEEWKYTNLRKLLQQEFEFNVPAEWTEEALSAHLIPDLTGDRLVFINGKYIDSLSKTGHNENITVCSLEEAFTEHSALVEAHLGQYATLENEVFTALSTALAREGAFVHLPKGKEAKAPVTLVYLNDTSKGQNVMSQPRNLIIAEENSGLQLIEQEIFVGEGQTFNNLVTEISVAKHARVDHYKLQDAPLSHTEIATTQVAQATESYYSNTTASLKGGLIRNNLNIALNGEHCDSHMNGLYMLDESSHVDNHTVVDHRKPHSTSNELYKGIMDGKSTGVFNGKIFVRQDAQKTNAFQSNKNILLSENATINTKPQLEIWADDVKCSHGATTGALDREPLFYLRSRGVPEKQAQALLMFAFAGDILNKIKVAPFRKYAERQISNRLGYTPED